jgi:DNA-3-methyladenine glycosylase
VLIRAVEPVAGLDEMQKRRRTDKIRNLANGPGKLFNAFGFDKNHHGEEVGTSIKILNSKSAPDSEIICGPRIGISKAVDLNWRFYIKGNKFISR